MSYGPWNNIQRLDRLFYLSVIDGVCPDDYSVIDLVAITVTSP